MTRIAVIGAGYWGKNIIRNIDALGALAAICDADGDALNRFAIDYPKAAVHSDPDAIFNDPSIDAVAIATPAVTHGALTRRALSAGKHVFVEKPICLSVEEGDQLVEQAKAADRILMVGHLLRYHSAFQALTHAVASGLIGQLRYIHSTRASFGKIRREENALWSFAPHDVSMILALADRTPTSVSCHGEGWLDNSVADLTLSHFTFDAGLQAHIFVSWLNPYKEHNLVVIGETGMIGFNDTVTGPDKLLHYPHSVHFDGNLPVADKATAKPLPFAQAEPLRAEFEHFIDCVATGAEPVTSGAEGLRVLRTLEACQQSLDRKQPISLAPAA